MGQYLLSAGSDINSKDAQGNTSLHNSCYHNSANFTSLLLRNGAGVNLRSKNLDTPLDYACEAGHIEIVKLLINSGADVNLCGENDWSPLHNAAGISRRIAVDVVKLLLKAGANAAAISKNGQYPCDVAEIPIVKELLIEAKVQALMNKSILSEPEKTFSIDSVSVLNHLLIFCY
jgi:ankyrin repeat protein